MTTTINMLAIDLAKGSFQVCAVAADGAVLYNRVLSRTRLTTLLAENAVLVIDDRSDVQVLVRIDAANDVRCL